MSNNTQYTPGDNMLLTLQYLNYIVSDEDAKAAEIRTLTPPEDLLEGFEYISAMLLLTCSEMSPLTPQEILQHLETLTLNELANPE